jgi:hypothetical protein
VGEKEIRWEEARPLDLEYTDKGTRDKGESQEIRSRVHNGIWSMGKDTGS